MIVTLALFPVVPVKKTKSGPDVPVTATVLKSTLPAVTIDQDGPAS